MKSALLLIPALFSGAAYGASIASTIASLIQNTAIIDIATVSGATTGNVTKFLGITYATAGRFRTPVAVPYYFFPINATAYGPSCPAQTVSSSSSSKRSLEFSEHLNRLTKRDTGTVDENCLSLNIIRPSTTRVTDKLPVVVWIYGGGFEAGSTLYYDTMSTRIVTRSIALGTPVIHVAMNYRLSALGFLASKEVQQEGLGNFGLYDQRVALRWVQKYIWAFGGDPTKVTIWGQSAGAISVSLQMLAFGGNNENLFRGAFMQSGAPVPVGSITNGQQYYDALVANTGCSSSSNTLNCLRTVSFATLQAAINLSPSYLSYEALALAWTPRVDGTFLRTNPYTQIAAGAVAAVPIVTGNCDDEGTVFSLSQTNVTTDAGFRDFVSQVFIPDASDADLAPLWTDYPDSPASGSPFDTGTSDVLYAEYKRIAAIQGDLVFQSPRRNFVQSLSGSQPIWTYLNKRLKTYSAYGSYHGSDLDLALLDDYLINFVNRLNPNAVGDSSWSGYTNASPNIYTFTDTASPAIANDTFRLQPFADLVNISTIYPL